MWQIDNAAVHAMSVQTLFRIKLYVMRRKQNLLNFKNIHVKP